MFNIVEFSNNAIFTSKHAAHYLRHCENYFKWRQSEEVLEIGCANGRITEYVLHPFVEKYINHLEGVDIDNDAINAAQVNNVKQNLGFSVMDIENEETAITHKNKYHHIFPSTFFILYHKNCKYNYWLYDVILFFIYVII